jgi:hypothetical protein
MEMRRLPVPAQTLVALVATGGATCLLLRVPDVSHWGGLDLAAFLLLTAGIVLTEQFQIPIRFGSEHLNLSLTEALWVGALILARPSVVTMAVAGGVLLGQVTRRRALHKLVFNACQFLLALSAAQVVVAALRSPGVLRPMTFVAVGLGMVIYAAINAGLVALVISLASGQPFQSVLLPPLPENALHFAANTALGLAALVMWHAAPGAAPVLVFPLAMSFVAYRTLLGRFAKQPEPVRETLLPVSA